MDFSKINTMDIDSPTAKFNSDEVAIAELCELQLALIGGGIGDVVPA